jgi:hypothetical protein
VTDEPPVHDERAATELQALADQGVEITVAGPGAEAGGGDPLPPGRQTRQDMPLPGQRRTPGGHGGPGGLGPQLRSAAALTEGPVGRVADMRRR